MLSGGIHTWNLLHLINSAPTYCFYIYMMNTVALESAELDRREESHLSQPLTSGRSGVVYRCPAINIRLKDGVRCLWLHKHVCPHVLVIVWREEAGGEGQRKNECFILCPTRKDQLASWTFYKQEGNCSSGLPEAETICSGSYRR